MSDSDFIETTGNRSAASALDLIVHRIELAFRDGDLTATSALIEEHLLEAWFGLNPDALLRMILAIESAGISLPPLMGAVKSMIGALATTPSNGDAEHTTKAPLASGAAHALQHPVNETIDRLRATDPRDFFIELGAIFALRLQGRPVEALTMFEALEAHQSTFQPLFTFEGGLGLFAVLQTGLTAMLAGNFTLAEAKLTEAKLHQPVPTLPFLTRDAHAKMALLHACFGDPAIARRELSLSEQLPRTNSWIEPVLDAQVALAGLLIDSLSPQQRLARLEAIPLNTLGEMWPFYVCAMRTTLTDAGLHDEVTRRLELLEQTNLPRADGQGLTGSIIPTYLALAALTSDNQGAANDYAQRTDPKMALTRLLRGVLALYAGDTRLAMRTATEARALTRSMRRLELLRLSLMATSLLLAGDHGECLETLRTALAMPHGLNPSESALFHESVHALAAEHLPEWPQPPAPLTGLAQARIESRQALTPRELEVLHGLARGLTRRQISSELFLSENTVKVHQQALYRKLGVSSKIAAVLEGERRGIL